MSEKIWIENSRYNQTLAAERAASRRRRDADRAVKDATEQLRRAEIEGLRASKKEEQLLNSRLRTETGRLLDGLDSVDAGLQNELRRNAEETQRQIISLQRSIADVTQQAERLDERLDELAQDVSERFRNIADSLAQERERARLYRNQYQAILSRIQELHPDKLVPGTVEQEYAPILQFLDADIINGDMQAAIGLAQAKIPAATTLQARLECLNVEFSQLRAEGRYRLEQLRGAIDQHQDPEHNSCAVDVDGHLYRYNGDISFWSNGLFDQIVSNYATVTNQFSEAEDRMDLDAMRMYIAQMNQIRGQLPSCVEFVMEEFQLFGMIQNLAIAITNVLTEDRSWRLTSSGYIENDERRSFQMAYEDGTGSIASFVIIPNRIVSAQGIPGGIQFLVDVYDPKKENDRYRCAVMRDAILSRLSNNGIEVGENNKNPQFTPGTERDSFVHQVTAEGDRFKDERIAFARTQLTLTNTVEE